MLTKIINKYINKPEKKISSETETNELFSEGCESAWEKVCAALMCNFSIKLVPMNQTRPYFMRIKIYK